MEELGDKLVSRDEDISKKERKLSTLQGKKKSLIIILTLKLLPFYFICLFFISLADLDRKNIEHQETVNQVKKLTQQFNIQSTPSKKKDKPHTAFFM